MLKSNILKENIKDNLFWDSRIDSSNIQVEVENNKVILNGSVPTESSKIIAREIAFMEEGIEKVENNLEASLKETLVLAPHDNLIEKIDFAITFNPEVSISEMKINLSDGKIIIEGEVHGYWQKICANKIACDIAGDFEIINNLNVICFDEYKDEYTLERIKNILKRKGILEELNIEIKIKEGIVSLMGNINNEEFYKELMNSVQFCPGVLGIKNEVLLN